MRILFLGAANNIHCVKWVNALSALGHELHLIYVKGHEPALNAISPAVQLHPLPFRPPHGYYLNAVRMTMLFRKIKPDVCNAHYASGYGTLARLAGLHPLLLSVWGRDVYDVPNESRWKRKTVLRNLRYADSIASTSSAMASRVRALLGEPDHEIPVTPFGVDVHKFSFGNIDYESEEPEEIIIGTVKTLRAKYGIDDLLRAFRIVADKSDIPVRMRIYGEGPDGDALRDLCTFMELDTYVTFCGAIPNDTVPEVLSKMHIFALASVLDSESFGVAAVEAMSVGLPIAATDVDGFREVIVNGETGLLSARRKPDALAENLLTLIRDRDLRRKMGENGRYRVLENYNWDDNVTVLENALLQLGM